MSLFGLASRDAPHAVASRRTTTGAMRRTAIPSNHALASPRAALLELWARERRRVRLLSLLRRLLRRDGCVARAAQGRHRPLLRRDRLDRAGRAARSRDAADSAGP